MKWTGICAALAAGMALFSAAPVSAGAIKHIHGATVYVPDESLSDDPANFVQVDGGNLYTTYADVSSAWVVLEDEEYIVVEAILWGLEHKGHYFSSENKRWQFIMHKLTGKVAHFRKGAPHVSPGSFILVDNTARLFAEAIRRREEAEEKEG